MSELFTVLEAFVLIPLGNFHFVNVLCWGWMVHVISPNYNDIFIYKSWLLNFENKCILYFSIFFLYFHLASEWRIRSLALLIGLKSNPLGGKFSDPLQLVIRAKVPTYRDCVLYFLLVEMIDSFSKFYLLRLLKNYSNMLMSRIWICFSLRRTFLFESVSVCEEHFLSLVLK